MPSSANDRPPLKRVVKPRGRLTGLLLYVVLTGMAVCLLSGHARAQVVEAAVDCAIQSGSCTKNLGGGTVTLDISPRPVGAMHDLTFTVTFSGIEPAHDPVIDLAMPGMIMGPNRVVLKRAGETTYQGTGVIVRCPSGRRTWKATVTLPDTGSAEFVFDVVY